MQSSCATIFHAGSQPRGCGARSGGGTSSSRPSNADVRCPGLSVGSPNGESIACAEGRTLNEWPCWALRLGNTGEAQCSPSTLAHHSWRCTSPRRLIKHLTPGPAYRAANFTFHHGKSG